MELNKVERLLKKHQAGETTSSEDKFLRNYFSQNKVPAQLEPYRLRFSSLDQDQNSFESKVSGKKFYVWGGVMVIIILAIGVFFLQQRNLRNTNNVDLGTFQDEELALEKTRETLQMVSELINESKKSLVYLKEFNNTRERIIRLEN